MRPEQKRMSVRNDIPTNFSRVGELVMNMFAKTFATGNVCIMRLLRWSFAG